MAGLHFTSGVDKGFENDLNRMNKEMNQFSSNVNKQSGVIDSSFKQIGATIGGVLSIAALAKAGQEIVTFSNDLQNSLIEVATISGEVTNNFDQYKNALLDMSNQSQSSAIQLSNAFYDIVSAGTDGAAGLELLASAEKASTAGFVDVGIAADGMTTVLNAWGLATSEAGRVSDIFFKTVEKGKTTFPELGTNIAKVAPLAASMGVSFEEVSGAIATVTKQGTKTPEALTQIRAAMVAMNDVLGDGWSASMTFQEGLQAIADKADGSQNKLKELLGTDEAVLAVLALTGKNAQMAASDLDAMNNSVGATSAAFEKVSNTATFQGKMLVNNLMSAFEPLGSEVVGTFASLAKSLNEAFESGDVERYAKILGTLIAAFAAWKIASFAQNKIQKIGNILMQEASVQTNLAARSNVTLSRSQALASVGMTKLSGAFKSLKAAFASNPIGLLVTGLTLAIPLITKFVNSQDKLQKVTADMTIEIQKEQTEANKLFEALKKTNPKSEERSEIVGRLNEKYPDLLKNYDLDVAGLNDIEKAQDAVNRKIVETIALRVQEEQIQGAAESLFAKQTQLLNGYLNNLDGIADKGVLAGVFGKIRAEIEKEGATNIDVAKKFADELGIEIKKGEYKTIVSGTGVSQIYKSTDFDKLLETVGKLNLANKDYLKTQKEIADFTKAFVDSSISEVSKPTKTAEELAAEEKAAAEKAAAEKAAANKLAADKKAKADEEYRNFALASLEVSNQQEINKITQNWGNKEDLEKEFNKKLLDQRLAYLTKLQSLTTDKLEKLRIEEERINTKAQIDKSENNNDEINDLLKQYQSYAQKRAALIKEANSKASKLQGVEGSKDAIKNIQKELEKSLSELDFSNIKSTTGINKIFEDTKNKSLAEIKELKTGADELLNSITTGEYKSNIFGIGEEEFKKLKDSPESVNLVREAVERLKQAANDTSLSFQKIADGFALINSASSNSELSEGLSQISEGTGEVIKAFEMLGDTMDSVFGTNVSSYISDITGALNNTLSGAATGAAIAGPTGAIVGGAIGLIGSVGKIIGATKAENEALKQSIDDTRDSIDKSLQVYERDLSRLQGKYTTVFGDSSFGQAFAATGKSISAATTQLDGYLNQLQGVNIKTKEGGWFHSDSYSGLLELYPTLIDEQGKLNEAVAEGILNSGTLDESQTGILQGALDTTTAIEDAYAAMADYLSGIFGSLSDDITQSFQDMYEGGDDAMISLEGSFSDMLESFTRDAIQFAFLQPVLDELDTLTTKMGEDYSAGNISITELQTGITSTLGDFYNSLNELQPSILQAYEDADELAAAAGFDAAFSGDSSAALDKATTSISDSITEQTGTEIKGRINAIMLSSQIVSENSSDMLRFAIQNSVTLNKIKENTDYLPQIAKYTKQTADKL